VWQCEELGGLKSVSRRIALGADHGGYVLKEHDLSKTQAIMLDCGAHNKTLTI
jgi:hypothetical protein